MHLSTASSGSGQRKFEPYLSPVSLALVMRKPLDALAEGLDLSKNRGEGIRTFELRTAAGDCRAVRGRSSLAPNTVLHPCGSNIRVACVVRTSGFLTPLPTSIFLTRISQIELTTLYTELAFGPTNAGFFWRRPVGSRSTRWVKQAGRLTGGFRPHGQARFHGATVSSDAGLLPSRDLGGIGHGGSAVLDGFE